MKHLVVLAFFLAAAVAGAQTQTITGTATDSDGQIWRNGSYKVDFYPNPSYPNLNQYYVDGSTPLSTFTTAFNGALDGAGSFSQSSIVNNNRITPAGSKWKFTVCPKASSQCGVFQLPVTANADITTTINSTIQAPRFLAVASSYGYNNAEAIFQQPNGATYWNVLSLCQMYYDGSAWACSGSGAGTTTILQVNGVPTTPVTPVNINDTVPAAPSGFLNVKFLQQPGSAAVSGYIPNALPASLQNGIISPGVGAYDVVYPSGFSITDPESAGNVADLKSAKLIAPSHSSGISTPWGTATWTYTLPATISSGSITAIYGVMNWSLSDYQGGFGGWLSMGMNCGQPGSLRQLAYIDGRLSPYPAQNSSTILTGSSGSNFNTIQCQAYLGDCGAPSCDGGISYVNQVYLVVYHTGPTNLSGALNTTWPIVYTSLSNSIGIDPMFPYWTVPISETKLPPTSTLQTPSSFLVTDANTPTECNTSGGGTHTHFCIANINGSYTAFGEIVSSILTTKGDILGHSTVDVRVPVGPDTTVLTADSTVPAGVSYKSIASVSPSSTWYNVVTQGGINNTCASDVGAGVLSLITGLSSSNPRTLFFPAGCYKMNAGIQIPCTVSTCNGIKLVGEGRDSTYFQSTCTNGYLLWYNNTTNSGDNWKGMQISDLSLQDMSGTGACQSKLKLTQTAMNVIERVTSYGSQSNIRAAGTIGISGNTVTGVGTGFTPAMVPGVLQVAGVDAEVCTYNSTTSLSLCDTAWPTGTVSAGTSYALTYGNAGIWLDPGFSYTQYITIKDYRSYGDTFCLYSQGTSSGGVSRVSVDGTAGWCDALRNTNSVGFFLGKHSDTFHISTPVNNVARCWVLDSAHANRVTGDCENNSTETPVSTCNGGVGIQSCLFGYEASADAGSTGYGDSVPSAYIYHTGTAFKINNAAGATNLSISGFRAASFSNTTNYSIAGTTGCPTSGSLNINNYDCNYPAASGGTTRTAVYYEPSGDTTGATDTAAIQASITAGTTTYLDKGSYYISGLTWTAPADILCDNTGGTTIFRTSTTTDFVNIHYGGGQSVNLSIGMTIRGCNWRMKPGVTPTAGYTFNLSGIDSSHFLSNVKIEDNSMYNLWGGAFFGSFMLTNFYSNNIFNTGVSSTGSCINYSTPSPGGDLDAGGDTCVEQGSFSPVIITQCDTSTFHQLKINGGSQLLFTGAAACNNLRFVDSSIEGGGVGSPVCLVDFGTGVAPQAILFTGTSVGLGTNSFCNNGSGNFSATNLHMYSTLYNGAAVSPVSYTYNQNLNNVYVGQNVHIVAPYLGAALGPGVSYSSYGCDASTSPCAPAFSFWDAASSADSREYYFRATGGALHFSIFNDAISAGGDWMVLTRSGAVPTAVTFIPPVVLPGNPTAALQAAPKQYVDLARVWGCQPGLGGSSTALTTGAFPALISCKNTTTSTWTITTLQCFTDNNGTSTLTITNSAGTALLTGAITCSNSFAAGTQSGTVTIAPNDYFKFTFTADGTSKQATFVAGGTF